MYFNVLDFLWFLIKLLGMLAIVIFLCSVIINFIINLFQNSQKHRREEMLDEMIKEALKNGKYETTIITDKGKISNTIEEKNKKEK